MRTTSASPWTNGSRSECVASASAPSDYPCASSGRTADTRGSTPSNRLACGIGRSTAMQSTNATMTACSTTRKVPSAARPRQQPSAASWMPFRPTSSPAAGPLPTWPIVDISRPPSSLRRNVVSGASPFPAASRAPAIPTTWRRHLPSRRRRPCRDRVVPWEVLTLTGKTCRPALPAPSRLGTPAIPTPTRWLAGRRALPLLVLTFPIRHLRHLRLRLRRAAPHLLHRALPGTPARAARTRRRTQTAIRR